MSKEYNEEQEAKKIRYKLKRNRNLMAIFTGTMAVGAIATSFISFPLAGGLGIAALVTVPELYSTNEDYKKMKTLTKNK